MKKILPALLLLGFALPAAADEQTRQIQSALAEAGFYFGTVDGKMGEETSAALRRFQIRNGLDVSGEASAETLSALKLRKTESAASEDEQQVASSARLSDPVPPPASRVRPDESRISEDTFSSVTGAAGRSPVRDFFVETDLENASHQEQTEALLDAQARLGALGYYRSAPDGLPGQETESALLRFQHACRLRLTARLDRDTRRALVESPPSVPSKPFRGSKDHPPGRVYRGVWVR